MEPDRTAPERTYNRRRVRILMLRPFVRVTLAALALAAPASPALAQWLPSEPISISDGRLTVGGHISATFSCGRSPLASAGACADDTGFFNYTDYEHSALRAFVVDVSAAVRATEHISVLGELRSENAGGPQPYALYVRVRPWTSRAFAIQAGRVPPTFGAFARRTYPSDNVLIGYPLAYQYLTSLRPDALPATADDLLRQRGRGWLSRFPVGDQEADRGTPLVSAFRWDTGVQAHAVSARWDAALSVTVGTQANPLVRDDNDGKQVAGRLVFRPSPALVLGVSGARGAFVTREAAAAAGTGDGRDHTQTAWGLDAEYSRDYYLVRVEAIVSDWRVPVLGTPALDLPLRAVATSVEGRYRLRPGLYTALRVDHLGFSEITGTGGPDRWDAPVTRVELGVGYSLQRNLLLKASLQHNTRDVARNTTMVFAAGQVVYWF